MERDTVHPGLHTAGAVDGYSLHVHTAAYGKVLGASGIDARFLKFTKTIAENP